ncbi:MAG: hypothetical protein PHX74_08170 [Candidatus Sumerlaeales bacterium]|jgi:hypothetical protein|nr:hypothetical protein [Candidatus Sumerlaeales bacterium]
MFAKVKLKDGNIAYFVDIDNTYNIIVGYSDNDGRPLVIDVYNGKEDYIRFDADHHNLDALYAAIEYRTLVCG